jgi:hypothetical protein
MRMQDRTAYGDNEPRVYNSVTSPSMKFVDVDDAQRYAMLLSMFPMLTPQVDRIIDHMMSLNNEQFRRLCRQEGTTVVLDHAVIDALGKSLDEKLGQCRSVQDTEWFDEDGLMDERLALGLTA